MCRDTLRPECPGQGPFEQAGRPTGAYPEAAPDPIPARAGAAPPGRCAPRPGAATRAGGALRTRRPRPGPPGDRAPGSPEAASCPAWLAPSGKMRPMAAMKDRLRADLTAAMKA